jgi:hypothetical protein
VFSERKEKIVGWSFFFILGIVLYVSILSSIAALKLEG